MMDRSIGRYPQIGHSDFSGNEGQFLSHRSDQSAAVLNFNSWQDRTNGGTGFSDTIPAHGLWIWSAAFIGAILFRINYN